MKKILLLIAGLAIYSCTNEPKIDYVLLSGKIDNPQGNKMMVSGDDFKKEITINEDGTFADTLRIDKGYYTLAQGREVTTFYAEPGNDLKVTLDTKQFDETIKYEGTGAANSNFIAAKVLAKENFDFKEVYSAEEADFIKTIKEKKTKAEDALKVAKDLSADFVDLEKSNINYEYLADLSRYPRYHAYFTKKEDYKVSDGFLKELEGINYDNTEDFKNFDSYRELTLGHYMNKIYEDSATVETLDKIQNLKSQNIKNEIAKQLSYAISPSNENLDKIYNTIQTISNDEELKKQVTKKYNVLEDLAEGKASPTFDYENHKGGTTSLADLAGKYVYIDVWATWCGPCIAEIPSLKKVEEKYHDKNIAFVSISIDQKNAYETWKKMVVDKELGGIQLMADNAWQSKFVTDYAIDGIPRFILIDPQGNIVSADAPRPSNPKLIELFDELKI